MNKLGLKARWLTTIAMAFVDLLHVFEVLSWTAVQLAAVNAFLLLLVGGDAGREDYNDWNARRFGDDYGE